MKKVSDYLTKVLRDKKTVITKAFFWKIPHDHENIKDVRLKIGRYKKPQDVWDSEELESLAPKSELTLDNEEFQSLVDFLQDNYEPFKEGFKDFIPIDKTYDAEMASKIKVIFNNPEKSKVMDFISEHNIISSELELALQYASRIQAINKFEAMLSEDKLEQKWQDWFIENSWVLGSEYVRILEDSAIDTENIADFLVEAYDGFLDIIEIKRPEGGLRFWSQSLDHDNNVPSTDLTKAITQASQYIYEVETEANSVKFQERIGNIRAVKPRCVLIFGRSNDWDKKQHRSYRILNSNFHNLSILTYDHVLKRAKSIIDSH